MTGYVLNRGSADDMLIVLRSDDESGVRAFVKWLADSTDSESQALAEEIQASLNGLGADD
jgi:hypothetical protein